MHRKITDNLMAKSGDCGMTSLVGVAIHKSNPVIECIGSIDEANTSIGVARSIPGLGKYDDTLDKIQQTLFNLSTDLIYGTDTLNQDDIVLLENELNKINKQLAPLSTYLLPKGPPAVLHQACAVVRRAERRFWSYVNSVNNGSNLNPGIYLNRLSDFLFAVCRTLDEEEAWKKIK